MTPADRQILNEIGTRWPGLDDPHPIAKDIAQLLRIIGVQEADIIERSNESADDARHLDELGTSYNASERACVELQLRAESAERPVAAYAAALTYARPTVLTLDDSSTAVALAARQAVVRAEQAEALLEGVHLFVIGNVWLHMCGRGWIVRVNDRAPSHFVDSRDEAIALARRLSAKETT